MSPGHIARSHRHPMVTTESAAIDVSAERRHERNAVIASFLGWTFDAFDFFVLTFLIADIAKAFGELRQNVAFTLTLTLAMRPVGALISIRPSCSSSVISPRTTWPRRRCSRWSVQSSAGS